jgi:hypothetical protein
MTDEEAHTTILLLLRGAANSKSECKGDTQNTLPAIIEACLYKIVRHGASIILYWNSRNLYNAAGE